MADVTFHDLPAGVAIDNTEDLPLWQAGGARRVPPWYVRRLRLNPAPISAAGTDLAGATVLPSTADYFLVPTVGAGQGVKFATFDAPGDVKMVRCASGAANDLLVYPSAAGKINETAVGLPTTIRRGTTVSFLTVSTTDLVIIA